MKKSLNVNINLNVDNLADLYRAVEAVMSMDVLVGVPDASADRRSPDDPMNNAMLAMIHDKGSPARNIPARPFLEAGIIEGEVKIVDALKKTAQAAIEGRGQAVAKGFEAVGLVAQEAVREKINEGPFEALAASTIAARKKRGRTGEKPLVDTGQLRNSINYVVRKNKPKK